MITKLRLVFTITIVFLSFSGAAQSTYWKNTQLNTQGRQFSKQRLKVENGRAFALNETQFKLALSRKKDANIIYFPDEDGKQIVFQVEETHLFAKALASKYPSIKSYKGRALNDPTKQVRFSVSHKGVQGMIVTNGEKEALFIQKSADDVYMLYRRNEQTNRDLDFTCSTLTTFVEPTPNLSAKLVDDQALRTFRVAISASGEYTQFHGGTKADALAAINATLTRVNAVFERDLAVTLELIANTDDVIYTDPETDPYDGSLSSQVQSTLASVIGEANYDIGHLFNQQNNTLDGNAGFIGSVCIDNRKGSAYATLSSPVGDFFDIDLVAHEMGHQFGANHSFSYTSEGTNVQVEPGSGTTLMGYAGITGNSDVAANSDDYFHYVSIVQVREYLQTVSCGQTQVLTNTPPTLTPLQDYNIPKGTPFVLTGEADDTDALDVLSYTWEQIDNGIVSQATFGPTNPIGANFRSLPPSTDPQRYFPKLERVLNGQLTQTLPAEGSDWETLSEVGRNFNFALTVRDNALNGGQSASDELRVIVVNDAGPFEVTSQDTPVSYVAGSLQTVAWNVARTNMAPIEAETVSLLLSTDGGLTYPIVLAENTMNDGEESIIVPSIETNEGRIMVKASDNIFYAVNDSDFSITPSEIVLNFDKVNFDVCKPNDNLSIPFVYETYLGFNEETTFSIVSPPVGLSSTFTPSTVIENETGVTLDLSGVADLDVGAYSIQVRASSASVTKEITLQLQVYDTNFTTVTLNAPADGFQEASKDVMLQWESLVGTTAYEVEIASDIGFTTLIESADVNTNSYIPALLENNAQYYWRVKPKNDCGEGTFGNPFGFSTIAFNCTTKEATALPISISSIDTPVVSSKITFLEDLPIADINVTLDLDHTFLSDLMINLISPTGTTVTLVSNSCGDSRNLVATFDDDAAPFACAIEPAISGTVQPLGQLSSFNGESILGEWTLEIRDNVPADGGQLNAFSLEICVEGDFRPDADNDGVFDDGDDLCLGTPEGQEVDASGCAIYRFPSENFSVSITSETCRDNNDGQIVITPKLALNYQVTVSGNGVAITQGFLDTFSLTDLAAGTYSLCIVGTDGSITYEEHCVDVQVSEPDALGVSSKMALDGTEVTLFLKGAQLYNIALNGVVVQTQEDTVVLALENGLNTLKVYTNIPCQGVYEEEFGLFQKPFVFPNPVKELAQVNVGPNQAQVTLSIFSADGRLMLTSHLMPQEEKITIDFSAFAVGLYYVHYQGETLEGTLNVIKE